MGSWTRSQEWSHVCTLLNILQLVQGLGRPCLLLSEQGDWLLPGHLSAASSAVIWWPHCQDQKYKERSWHREGWGLLWITSKGSLRKYGHVAEWDEGHGGDHCNQGSLLYALMPSMLLSSAVQCGLVKHGPQARRVEHGACKQFGNPSVHTARRNTSKGEMAWCHCKVALCHCGKTDD